MSKEIKKVKKLSNFDIENFEKTKKDFDECSSKIIDRINYILEVLIHEVLSYKGSRNSWTWYFSDATQGEVGSLKIDKDGVYDISIEFFNSEPEYLDEILDSIIPLEYLTSDSFKEDYKRKLDEFKLKEKNNKEKRKKYREKKKKVDAILEKERKRLMKELD